MEHLSVDVYLRTVRTLMNAGGVGLQAAIEMVVPTELRPEVEAAWQADRVQLLPPSVISGTTRPEWYHTHDPASGYYWPRLRTWLLEARGRSESAIEALDVASDEVLSKLTDPRPSADVHQVDDRGLVLGYIQSGKTANFTAVIAKGFDAGFRIVIVLSGLHNSLRRQTQLRIEDELGLVASTDARPTVGSPDAGREIVRMTRADLNGDFAPGTADTSLLRGTVPLIFVVKKNASVLRRLVGWLQEGPAIDFPVLIIDDEADQGSINTGSNRPLADSTSSSEDISEEYDLVSADVDNASPNAALTASQVADEVNPSVINGLIRQLLRHFARTSYVGYTATPFANVLINHDAVDREVLRDLYPKDFIISLPKPNGYVGPETLFGRDAIGDEAGEPRSGLDVITTVSVVDAQALNPPRTSGPLTTLPESLKAAILDFFIALASRDARTNVLGAGAMLIHGTSTAVRQVEVAGLVRDYVAVLRQRWRYNPGEALPIFQARWQQEFVDRDRTGQPPLPTFEAVAGALSEIFRRGVPTLTLNHLSTDELDYERDPSIRAIVVGGNKLSRGLTIEGLMVSYYVRTVNYYDTLLQMGRWFGYRMDYVDLTRLHTTEVLKKRFKDLATAEEELRRDIRLYEALGKSPLDFGPRIRSHPTMTVTARNRMGSGRVLRLDLSASLTQTILFPFGDEDWLSRNLSRTRKFLSLLGEPSSDSARPTWYGVDWRLIADLLSGEDPFEVHPDSTRSIAEIWSYIESKVNHGELTGWTVGVRSRLSIDARLGSDELSDFLPRVARINRSRESESLESLGSIANPATFGSPGGDEELGLDDAGRQWAHDHESEFGGYSRALRARRPPADGLLLLYPISPASAPAAAESHDKAPIFADPTGKPTIVGLAWSFPASSFRDPEYIVGSVGHAP